MSPAIGRLILNQRSPSSEFSKLNLREERQSFPGRGKKKKKGANGETMGPFFSSIGKQLEKTKLTHRDESGQRVLMGFESPA